MMERGRFYFLTPLLLLLLLVRCTQPSEKQINTPEVTDDLGRTIRVKSTQKILSLTPSINEILYKLIDEDRIIARTPYDSFPAAILTKPVINNYPPDLERILTLSPDLIVAKEGMLGKDDMDRLAELGFPVYMQRYESLTDIYHSIQSLGKILDCQSKSDSLVGSIKYQVQSIEDKTTDQYKPKILIIISLEPLYVFGNNSYVNDLMVAAGGVNAMTELMHNPYPIINREYLLKLDSDIILGTDMSGLLKYYPEMKLSKAVKLNNIYPLDTEILSRPGPRVVEGIERINEIINVSNK
jgi:iron complex transport system substrate-binding protein